MDLPTFITVISILIAVYALLPRATQLTLSLKITWVDWLIFTLFILVIHYIFFFDLIQRLNLDLININKTQIVKREEFPYLFLLVFIFYFSIRFKFFGIPIKKINHLHKLIEELLASNKNHPQLINILSKNLNFLGKLCDGNTWSTKARRLVTQPHFDFKIMKFNFDELSEQLNSHPKFEFPIFQKSNLPYFRHLKNKVLDRVENGEESLYPLFQPRNLKILKRMFLRMLSVPANLLPNYEDESRTACEILNMTLSNRNFVQSIASLRPYFAIQVWKLNLQISHDFTDLYLTTLIKDNNSVLYSELRNNQNIGSDHDYYIPTSNKLLGFLFGDANIAKNYSVWKPIGDAVLLDLEQRRLSLLNDEYNYPIQGGEDQGHWESQIYIGIRFFDIMVSKAIIQNISWHMWLYYFEYFVEKICKNYKRDHFDPNYFGECPSQYSSFLYKIIFTLKQLISMIHNLDQNQENLRLNQGENGNPIKSSMIVLTRCLNEIANCKEVPQSLKDSLNHLALDLYLTLRQVPKTAQYATHMMGVLIKGGEWDTLNKEYLGNLLRTLVYQDNIPYEHDLDNNPVLETITKIAKVFNEEWGISALSEYLEIEEDGNKVILKSQQYRTYTVELSS